MSYPNTSGETELEQVKRLSNQRAAALLRVHEKVDQMKKEIQACIKALVKLDMRATASIELRLQELLRK